MIDKRLSGSNLAVANTFANLATISAATFLLRIFIASAFEDEESEPAGVSFAHFAGS